MALDFFPPAVLALLVDAKEFNAKMDAAMAKLEEVDGVADKSGGGFTKFASKASTAIIATGAAVAAYSVVEGAKYQESLDKLRDTTNITASMLAHVGKVALKVSDDTGASAEDIVAAYGAVEAAGYNRAKADAAVAAAAKMTLIIGGDVVDNTQSLIAAQNLGITKNMSAAKVADLFTIATKGNEAGLAGVVNLLQGKVGSAFAGYGQSAGEAVAVANEFSLAHITQTRQIASFIQKMGALQGPLETTTVMNGKLETSSASYVNSLVDVGLNVNKTRDAFAGPNGLINGLKYLKTTADGSLPQLRQYLTAIFGATGVGPGMALIENLDKVTATAKAANQATSGGLNTAANIASSQLGNQLKIIEQRLRNAAITFGLKLLPYVKDAADLLIKAMNYLSDHPEVLHAAMIAAAGIFAAAVGYKLVTAAQGVLSALGRNVSTTAQTTTLMTPLDLIASNTTDMVGLLSKIAGEDLVGGHGGGGLLPTIEHDAPDATPLALPGGVVIAADAAGSYYLYKKVLAPTPGAVRSLANVPDQSATRGGTNKPPFKGAVLEVVGVGADASTMWVTAKQLRQYDASLAGGGKMTKAEMEAYDKSLMATYIKEHGKNGDKGKGDVKVGHKGTKHTTVHVIVHPR
jgi:TP901 family phage tail tape measure protein